MFKTHKTTDGLERDTIMGIKVKGLRWWMIALLSLGTVMNYLARSSLSVAAPTVMQSLHISTGQYGWITGAFLVMYPLGGPLTGYLMDRIGLRFGFLLCGLAWSCICMAAVRCRRYRLPDGRLDFVLFTLVMGALVMTIGYTPFFVALGFGDLIGAALIWSLVRPALVERRRLAPAWH
ncbi:Major Facilitator Superfamily protein [Paraburkholderia phenazinium]|uniref:Major Facilitator Superfamily protein n=2 Tax=Paraburkholderia phenazinium TaxID=60549 RepID=A0A1G8BI91_9BURK|nr:Major Facilitator Superfamily protein [Paraburkholderia phenazinium]